MNTFGRNRALHTTALLTAAATFPLIFMGGLVTSHQAGMSVPDWPNSYGYNMFTFPPSKWVGGIFYEHTHRLMGTVVGMLSIVMAAVAWRTEPRRWVRWLCVGVLGAVIFQGVLGGLRVVLVKLDLAIAHACVAQAVFSLIALTCVATSRWWNRIEEQAESIDAPVARRLVRLGATCTVAIYLQLVVGATMRHYDAGLAIPDLPFAYGRVLPPTGEAALDLVNQQRAWQTHLQPVTLGQVWLHFGHRIGAVLVMGSVVAACAYVFARHRRQRKLLVPAVVLLVLLVAQVILGVYTVLLKKPADIASAHVAVGALVLLTSVVLTARAARMSYVARLTAAAASIEAPSQPRTAMPREGLVPA